MTDSPEAGPTPGPYVATDVDYPDDGTLSGADQLGRWTVSTRADRPGWQHDGGYPGYGLTEANARLLAASWELREALRGIVDDYANSLRSLDPGASANDVEAEPEIKAARAALAKADGRS